MIFYIGAKTTMLFGDRTDMGPERLGSDRYWCRIDLLPKNIIEGKIIVHIAIF